MSDDVLANPDSPDSVPIEISIVPFRFKYLDMVIELHGSQNYAGIEHICMKNLPKVGFVAMIGGQPIACGFLRRVEGGFAQMDTLASNAYFGSKIRHAGITMVVAALIQEAKRLKLRGIISFSKDNGVLKRAETVGFHKVDQTLIALPLTI